MATREEVLEGDIRELKGEIRQLNTEIGVLESNQQLTPTDISLGAKISEKTALMTAKTGLLTVEKQERLLLLGQQGKVHHIFPLFFPNLLEVILCPNLFRHLLQSHPGSAKANGKNDGSPWNTICFLL